MACSPAEDANEIGRNPRNRRLPHHAAHRKTEDQIAECAAPCGDKGSNLTERGLKSGNKAGAHGFFQRQYPQSNKQAWQADYTKQRLPRLHMSDQRQIDRGHHRDQRAARDRRDATADIGCANIQAHRTRALLGWEFIADHRIGTRRQRRLPHTDSNACKEKLDEVLRETTDRGHHAPNCNAGCDNRCAFTAINHATNRYSHDRIEECKGEAMEEAYLGVADLQRFANRANEKGQYLPVNKRESVGDDQYEYHIPAIWAGALMCWLR